MVQHQEQTKSGRKLSTTSEQTFIIGSIFGLLVFGLGGYGNRNFPGILARVCIFHQPSARRHQRWVLSCTDVMAGLKQHEKVWRPNRGHG